MIQFKTGSVYRTRSPGDHDCILDYKIISRTDKTLKSFDKLTNEVKTYRISAWREVEQFYPWGKFSMSPVMSADNEIFEEVLA
jgi:virulence-associated protein VapD